MSSDALQWLTLVVIIWLQSVNGTNTTFPAYSPQLKELLSMSQVQLNNLSFASDAGKLLGFLSGMAALYLPLWLVLFIGSTLGFVGYGLQYLFITHQISSLSYAHIFLLTVLAGNSICWINTVCYVVIIQNFPSDRQVSVGLTTSYQGLSAKIYTVLVDALFSSPDKRAGAYLLLNSISPLVVCVLAAPFVRDVNVGKSENMKAGFIAMFLITIATGIYAVISSLGSLPSSLPPLGNVIGISVFLLAPLAIPIAETIREVLSLNEEIMNVYIEKNGGDDRVERIESGIAEGDDHRRENEVGVKEEIGVMLMLKRVDFWLYFFVYFSGATLGLVYSNNLGQIAESRGFSGTSSLVSLCSSFGFFGRLMPSLLDFFLSRYNLILRPAACIAALMAPMAGAFFLLLNTTSISLYISTAIICACTGAITSISVSTTTELFGTRNFSVNHNVVVANIPLGSFIFGYSAAVNYHREGGGDGKCMGMQCYRNTFIIWGSLCLFGTFLAVVLYARLRKFYSHR
ncbi:PREDICTED: uncharacterized protein LOC105137685 isoform X2 [Populus euphratica]|uniref:Uncharacterized protein LOC105137685 isoform X2 n=1 Tax=Populus euphratica TaxID=75702 RepID=A0AAJ6V5Z1_POPEU|nr:PREDICTED: uncharacterized protein LOC105137685 isoform X2 [Populus euphratica]